METLCEEVHPSLDTKHLKRQAEIEMADKLRKRGITVDPERMPTGAEAVARELDELNAKHQRLLDMLYERLRRIAAANPGDIVTLVSFFYYLCYADFVKTRSLNKYCYFKIRMVGKRVSSLYLWHRSIANTANFKSLKTSVFVLFNL